MERNLLIAFLIGKFCERYPKDNDAVNLKIFIDNYMMNCNLPPLNDEDNGILTDLLSETVTSVLNSGMNRKTRRTI